MIWESFSKKKIVLYQREKDVHVVEKLAVLKFLPFNQRFDLSSMALILIFIVTWEVNYECHTSDKNICTGIFRKWYEREKNEHLQWKEFDIWLSLSFFFIFINIDTKMFQINMFHSISNMSVYFFRNSIDRKSIFSSDIPFPSQNQYFSFPRVSLRTRGVWTPRSKKLVENFSIFYQCFEKFNWCNTRWRELLTCWWRKRKRLSRNDAWRTFSFIDELNVLFFLSWSSF